MDFVVVLRQQALPDKEADEEALDNGAAGLPSRRMPEPRKGTKLGSGCSAADMLSFDSACILLTR